MGLLKFSVDGVNFIAVGGQITSTDDDAIHDNVAGEIAAITEKVTPVDADLVVIEDSADGNSKKRAQLGNLPGGGGGSSLPVVDTTSIAKGSVDDTKEVRFEVDGNAAGVVGVLALAFSTAKTVTFPDADDTLVGKATTDELSSKTLLAPIVGTGAANRRIILNQTTGNYTILWGDPAAARNLTIVDPGANDNFAFESKVILKAFLDAKGNIISASADNTPVLLAVGANGRKIIADSAEASGLKYVPGWEEMQWYPQSMIPTASDGAVFGGLTSTRPAWFFDGAVDKAVIFEGDLPDNYSGGGLTLRITWSSGNTTGDFDWLAGIERVTGQDLMSSGFAANQSVINQTVSTVDVAETSEITFTDGAQMDSVLAGEPFRVLLSRDANVDTSTNDAYIIRVRLVETQ